jgi:Protein kinase domain/Fibronectin type III domain
MSEANGGETSEIPGFQDLKVIGRTQSSVVYRALDTELRRPVAIKVLLADNPDDPAWRRFDREREITANLGRHPYIVAVLGTGFTPSKLPYVVMDYYEKGSVATRLRTDGPFAPDEVADIGAKVAEALTAAHQAGVMHRDIKPENVLLSAYGPALADFGIARTIVNREWSGSLELLTIHHAPPEILLGELPTPQADIYSLGSTLYTMLAGHSPYAGPTGENAMAFQQRVQRDPLPPLERNDVPAELGHVLETALAKEPQQRWSSAAEIRDALRAIEPNGSAQRTPSASHAGGAAPQDGEEQDEQDDDRDQTMRWVRPDLPAPAPVNEPTRKPRRRGTAAALAAGFIVAAAAAVVVAVLVVGGGGGGPVVAAPTGASVVARSDGTADISWNAVTMKGGRITAYTVFATDRTSNTRAVRVASVNAPTLTVQVPASQLIAGHDYVFTVSAIDAQSHRSPVSAPSAPVRVFTRPAPPAHFVAVPRNGGVELTWDRPADLGGGQLVNYVYGITGGQIQTTTTMSACLSGLANGTTYVLALGAETSANGQTVYGSPAFAEAAPSATAPRC